MTPPASATLAQPPTERLLEWWDEANDVLYTHDLAGRFTHVNATACRVYGYTKAEFLGITIKDLVDPAHLPRAVGNLQAKAGGATEHTAPYELLTRTKDGRAVWVEVSTRVLLQDGKPVGVQGSARDITARKEAEAVAELVHEAALSLHQAVSFEAGVQQALALVARSAGWQYAESWIPDADGQTLVLGPVWNPDDAFPKFTRLARQHRFSRGEGLAGRVWGTGKTEWTQDLATLHGFTRGPAAMAAGLRLVVAVPVAHAGEVVAVLLFFAPTPKPEDARWVAAAEKVAAQLGAAFGRRLDVERVRTAGRLFAAQFEAHDDALLVLDAEGTPRLANGSFLDLVGATLVMSDAAVPLVERVADRQAFLRAVSTLYEDRSVGFDRVRFQGVEFARTVRPLRSRNGTSLGVLLRLRRSD